MQRLLLSVTFFLITPFILFICIIYYSYLSYHRSVNLLYGYPVITSTGIAFAALPTTENSITVRIEKSDARAEILRQFFTRHSSPLAPYAEDIVENADEYGLDFRLIPAIAMQESTLCRTIPENSHNCWGFGIYGNKVTRFEDYQHGIETVTKTLAKNYAENKGLATPEEIMTIYTPSNNGDWAQNVNHFMSLLQ